LGRRKASYPGEHLLSELRSKLCAVLHPSLLPFLHAKLHSILRSVPVLSRLRAKLHSVLYPLSVLSHLRPIVRSITVPSLLSSGGRILPPSLWNLSSGLDNNEDD
jgi:hypothetical protein